jgi:hypothetical protein
MQYRRFYRKTGKLWYLQAPGFSESLLQMGNHLVNAGLYVAGTGLLHRRDFLLALLRQLFDTVAALLFGAGNRLINRCVTPLLGLLELFAALGFGLVHQDSRIVTGLFDDLFSLFFCVFYLLN